MILTLLFYGGQFLRACESLVFLMARFPQSFTTYPLDLFLLLGVIAVYIADIAFLVYKGIIVRFTKYRLRLVKEGKRDE